MVSEHVLPVVKDLTTIDKLLSLHLTDNKYCRGVVACHRSWLNSCAAPCPATTRPRLPPELRHDDPDRLQQATGQPSASLNLGRDI
jgi:hypothetical protein